MARTNKLSDAQQSALLASYIEGVSVINIADFSDISLGTVYTYLKKNDVETNRKNNHTVRKVKDYIKVSHQNKTRAIFENLKRADNDKQFFKHYYFASGYFLALRVSEQITESSYFRLIRLIDSKTNE